MRLDYECVRDVLITLEKLIVLDEHGKMDRFDIDNICAEPRIHQCHNREQVLYTLLKLKEAGYIRCTHLCGEDVNISFMHEDGITFNGHQYLDAVRSDKVWSKTKLKLGKYAAAVSLDVIKTIASAIAIDLILH